MASANLRVSRTLERALHVGNVLALRRHNLKVEVPVFFSQREHSGGVHGLRFATWAPRAHFVSVVGATAVLISGQRSLELGYVSWPQVLTCRALKFEG